MPTISAILLHETNRKNHLEEEQVTEENCKMEFLKRQQPEKMVVAFSKKYIFKGDNNDNETSSDFS